MIRIEIDNSLALPTAKVYVNGALQDELTDYVIDHKPKKPKKLDITLTRTNPTYVQIGDRLWCF